MKNKRNFVHKGWLLHRLEKLPDMSPTHEVARILKVSVETLRRWCRDAYFRQYEVAVKGNSSWLWHKAKLRAWLLCLYGTPDSNAMSENPGGAASLMTREAARETLGMPLNYSVRMGRELTKGGSEGEGEE